MLNLKSVELLQIARLAAALALTAPLAGCALDDFARDERIEPYGGAKLHPIVVANGKASVGECDDWTDNRGDTLSNTMSASHGCAVQSNIAAMAANPSDLVKARRLSRAPAFSRVPAINSLAGATASSASGEASASPKP
jgi:Pilus biogenesis CpaD protein (pilus_cpaD)